MMLLISGVGVVGSPKAVITCDGVALKSLAFIFNLHPPLLSPHIPLLPHPWPCPA